MLLCGAAKADINPDFPIHLMGYRADLISNAVHDDIHVTVLYLKRGDAQVAVLTYDMITLNTAFIDEVQAACSEAAGLPPRAILTTVSHSHSTPTVTPGHGGTTGDQFKPSFREKVVRQSAAALREAVENAEPVTVHYNTTRIRENLNRRVFFPNGQYFYQPKQKLLKAVGEEFVDDELGVIFFRCTGRDAYKATLVTYTAHPLTIGDTSNQVSADYPGVLKREIETSLGGVALFINGAAGDNHPLGAEAGFGRCERMGQALAEAALYHRWDAAPLDDPALACDYRELIVPALSRKQHEALPQNFASRYRVRQEDLVDGGYRTCISLWSLGPILFAGMPGEITAELGKMLKWRSPFPKAFMMYIATDSLGYIAHRNAFLWGGYEALSSRVGPDAGTMLVDEAVRAAEGMRSKLEAAGANLMLPAQSAAAPVRNEPGTAR